jgi:Sigma-70, region 4
MRKTKELLRLRFELGFGQRQIARSCGMGVGTVHRYLERLAAGIGWPLPEGLSEEEVEAKLFGNQPVRAKAERGRHNRTGKLGTKLDVLRNGRCCKSILGGLILNFL